MTDIDAVLARVRAWENYCIPHVADRDRSDIRAIIAHVDAQAAEIADLRRQVAEAWEAVRVRDGHINVTVKTLRARVEALTAALTDIIQDIANYGVPPRETQERARAALAGKE